MAEYLDFDNPKYQKGYALFEITKESAKNNIGKEICYLLKKDFDEYRGYMKVRYGTIDAMRYNQVKLKEYDSFDIRDVLEAGIKIEEK